MVTRRTRAEQAAYNRDQVLAAARAVFEEKGFHAASVDEVAERAGFSKGVVYSQFGSKHDLFFALLERRIELRARENLEVAATSGHGLRNLAERARATLERDRAWNLLLIEFRVFAARNPEVNQRYIDIHQRTIAGIARALEVAVAREGFSPRFSTEELARFALAIDAGFVIEDLASGGQLSFEPFETALRLLAGPNTPGESPTEATP